ncbi:DmsE family decaheme c-type cytochrome [Noviherbaspirillum sp. ST9]|uniref:DmsE family decaheme c-type cytochrome n=1 Tax=Noviherbaspirillum sp. ST9 TaxID=3401606 RepID=UPI003B586808
MKLWQKAAALAALTLGMAIGGPAFAADDAKRPQKDLVLKGDARCTACHDEADEPKLLAIGKSKHGTKGDPRTPTCRDCHKESDKHADHKGKDKPPKTDIYFSKDSTVPAKERDAVCQSCHQGGNRMHWESSAHSANGVTCTSCHKVHTQHDKVRDKKEQTEVCFTCHKNQRAESYKASHHAMREGKVTCSSCHNTHGSTGPKQLIKNTVNETCYTCHTEKRGPFLFEHPVASDNCMNCHNSHGSNNPSLLKARQPYLCSQCHDFTQHPGNPYSGRGLPTTAGGTAPAQQLLLRSCASCHTQVHGTNHPSGARYTR